MKLIVAIIKAYIVLSCAVLEVAVVIGFFSTSPKTISDFFTFIIFIIICSAMIYWILRIKKPKKTNIPMKQVLNNSNIDYFTLQADGNIGVFNDCLNLVQKTKKIDTFFMRYDLGLQKIVTLKEAIKAKTISIPNINEMENNFVDIAQSRKKSVLIATIDAEYQRISKLKTPKTRHKHWSDLLKQIEQYEGYYHDCKDFYLQQIQFIKGQILNNSQ